MVVVPSWIQKLFPHIIWKKESENKIYLTFDDGPIPESTPLILDILSYHNAKATFFCVGKNVSKYPKLYDRIIVENHKVGNHSNSHFNGWFTCKKKYINDVEKAAQKIDSTLFRPPYGKMSLAQYIKLKSKFKIIYWTILSKDYLPNLGAHKCLQNITSNLKPGSIVVLHDNLKSIEKLKFVLPRLLEYIEKRGWETALI